MKKLTDRQWAELEALNELTDDQIDYSDIPEITDWSGARRGIFHTPRWTEITLQLDQSVIDWFQEKTDGPEEPKQDLGAAVNQALIDHIRREKFPRSDGSRRLPGMS